MSWRRSCNDVLTEVIVMKLSLIVPAALFAAFSFAAVAVPTVAHADAPDAPAPRSGSVSCVSGKFGDHVEGGRAVGDAGGIFNAKKAVYDVDIANDAEATQVVLVWSLDGHEVQRQTLDVGHSGHWHTWGMRPIGNAKKIDVEVLDAGGHSLKSDSLSVS